jgi:hypothetical protein
MIIRMLDSVYVYIFIKQEKLEMEKKLIACSIAYL